MQMADNAPGARQAFDAVIERCDKIFPGGGNGARRQLCDECAGFGEQRIDGGADVCRFDAVKTGKSGKVE